MISWVAGSSTVKVLPLRASTHFPSMNIWCFLARKAAAAELSSGRRTVAAGAVSVKGIEQLLAMMIHSGPNVGPAQAGVSMRMAFGKPSRGGDWTKSLWLLDRLQFRASSLRSRAKKERLICLPNPARRGGRHGPRFWRQARVEVADDCDERQLKNVY